MTNALSTACVQIALVLCVFEEDETESGSASNSIRLGAFLCCPVAQSRSSVWLFHLRLHPHHPSLPFPGVRPVLQLAARKLWEQGSTQLTSCATKRSGSAYFALMSDAHRKVRIHSWLLRSHQNQTNLTSDQPQWPSKLISNQFKAAAALLTLASNADRVYSSAPCGRPGAQTRASACCGILTADQTAPSLLPYPIS